MDRSDVPITLMGVPAVCSGHINVVAMFGRAESEGIHLVQVVRVTRRCGSDKYLKSQKFLDRYSGSEHVPVRTSLEFRLLFRDAAFPDCYKVEPECVYSFASAEEVSDNTKAATFAHLSTKTASSFSPHEDDDDTHADPTKIVHPFTLASRVDGCCRTDRTLAARDQKAETPALVMKALGIALLARATPPTPQTTGLYTQDEDIPLIELANRSIHKPSPQAMAQEENTVATTAASPAMPSSRGRAVASPEAPIAASPKQPAKRIVASTRATPVQAPTVQREPSSPVQAPPKFLADSSPIEPELTSKQRRKQMKDQIKIERNARKYTKKLEKQVRQEAKQAKDAKTLQTDTATPRRQTERQSASSQKSTPMVSHDMGFSQEPLTFPDSVPSIMLERRYDPSEILQSARASQEAPNALSSLDSGPSPLPSKPARQARKKAIESAMSVSVPSSHLKAPPTMKPMGDITSSGGVTPAVSQPLFPASQQSPSQAMSELFDLPPNTNSKITIRSHKPPIIVPVSASPSTSVLRGNSFSQFEVPSSQPHPPVQQVQPVSPPAHVTKAVVQQHQPVSKPRVVITQRTVKGHRRARSLSSSSSEDLPLYRAHAPAAPAKAAPAKTESERPFRPEPSNPSRAAAASGGRGHNNTLLPSPSDISGGIVMSSDDGSLLGDGLMLPPSNAPEKEPHDDSSDYAAGHRHKTRERMLGLKYGGSYGGGVDSSDVGGESGSLVPAPRANQPTMRASRPSPTETTQPPTNTKTSLSVKPAPRPTIPPPQSPALSFSQIPTRLGVVAPQRALSESTEDSSTVTDDSD